MKSAWTRAERESEVRRAARHWREADAIDDATLAAIEGLYPAPWPQTSLVWSVLAFVFVSFAVVGLAAAIASLLHTLAGPAFLFAAVLAFTADRLRPSASGVAAASGAAGAFWAVLCLLVGVLDAWHWREGAATGFLLIAAAAWAAAAWRWGYAAFAAFAGVFLFLFLARFSQGPALWLILGTVLAIASTRWLDRAALAPSHRRSAAAVLAVCLVAVYAAVNPYSLDRQLIESVANGNVPATGPSAAERIPAAAATAVFPVLLIAWGVRSRRALALDVGVVFAALSLATLRTYVPIAPLWAFFAIGGAGLIGLALRAHRWLSRSPGRRRGGFTADALFDKEQRQETLGALGVAIAFAPEPRSPSPPEAGAFRGGGGSSGGAGSGGSWD